MKITKQRLKEIIREELEEGSRDKMTMPALSDEDFYQSKRARMTMPAVSQDDMDAAMATTEPRFEAGSPEGKLINKLLIHAKVEGAHSPEDAAALLGLGNDEEVIEYIGSLMDNPMYGRSGMEESSQSGGSPPSTAADRLDPSAQQWSSKGRKKAASKKRRSVEKKRIKKGKA